MLPFLITMLALLILGLALDVKWLSGTALVLLGNWLAEIAMVRGSNEQFPWLFFIVADYMSALIILCMRPNRWQIMIAAVYAVQIICHAAFGFCGQTQAAKYYYWYALTYTGWAQLALVIGGGVYALHRRRDGASSGVSHTVNVLECGRESDQ